MIRPFTCICMLLAAGSGLYLYQTKHRAQLLDREIARTYKQIDQTKDRIGVLKGEWALLNEPERLAELANQHLALKTLAPNQFVALADLGNRLPAPLPPGQLTLPDDSLAPSAVPLPTGAPVPAAVPIAAAKPAPVVPRTYAAADKTPDRTPDKTADKTADKIVEKAGDKPAPHAATHPATVVASAMPAPRPMAPPVPVPQAVGPVPQPPHFMAPVMNVSAQDGGHAQAPGSVGEAVARANRNRTGAPMVLPATSTAQATYSQTGYAQVSNAPPAYAQPSYGSALGGASRDALPAPVPYSSQAVR